MSFLNVAQLSKCFPHPYPHYTSDLCRLQIPKDDPYHHHHLTLIFVCRWRVSRVHVKMEKMMNLVNINLGSIHPYFYEGRSFHPGYQSFSPDIFVINLKC